MASDVCLVPCEISRQALQPTLYTLESIKAAHKRAKVLLIGYKDYEGKGGYTANLNRDCEQALKGSFVRYTKSTQEEQLQSAILMAIHNHGKGLSKPQLKKIWEYCIKLLH